MYQKRKERQENKLKDDNEKGSPSVQINWFPGHMVKAKKEIIANLKLVDVVIEVVDARIPKSSRNPDFDEIIGSKPRIIALNKFDLADEKITKEWIEFYKKQGIQAVLVNSIKGTGLKEVLKKARETIEEKLRNSAEKGRIGRTVKIAVLGIPNAGKSSFINKIAGKNIAEVGNKPGVTRTKQWIRAEGTELMDTPGVLWPKFQTEEIGLNLAFTGAIRFEILDNEELALRLISMLRKEYKELVCTRYKLTGTEDLTDLEMLEKIGEKRGCKVSGGSIDYTKTANIIMDEFRKGVIGKISLEKPGE